MMMQDNIAWTNDDATSAKLSAVSLKYWEDDHISELVNSSQSNRRRTPEINRGYWARIAAVDHLVEKFLELSGENGQIINLGAGFDSLFWRLSQKEVVSEL